ncbi:MAG TPA: HDIG domain-containing protein [Candidatus Bathyarchaeota archaeon]|nr:HDIG domain-containing protein [Candidatus Bathyarchaeota archaeon]HEW89802.1 HDIG domain-containing protein [Candidatus Bathyarchaeota archaeon]
MPRSLPSREEAIRILKAVGCPKNVVAHCMRVADLAVRLAEGCRKAGFSVDVALVEVGALLHDIGRARARGIAHAFVGAEMARELGLSERLVMLIARHTGGVRPGVAEDMGWPPGEYAPETLEEKIVAYADKLVEGKRILPFEEALKKLKRELGPGHPAVKNLTKIHEELQAMLRRGRK